GRVGGRPVGFPGEERRAPPLLDQLLSGCSEVRGGIPTGAEPDRSGCGDHARDARILTLPLIPDGLDRTVAMPDERNPRKAQCLGVGNPGRDVERRFADPLPQRAGEPRFAVRSGDRGPEVMAPIIAADDDVPRVGKLPTNPDDERLAEAAAESVDPHHGKRPWRTGWPNDDPVVAGGVFRGGPD